MVEEFWFITSLLSTAFVPSSVCSLEAFKKALVCQIRAAFSPTYFQWHEKKTRDQFRSLVQHNRRYQDQAFCEASFFGDVVVAEHHKCIQPLAEISCGIYNFICYYTLPGFSLTFDFNKASEASYVFTFSQTCSSTYLYLDTFFGE